VVERPYVLLSCGMSLDGYLDDTADDRLLLSNDADFDRVDGVRASCDAILVGATTIRQDDPRLLIRSADSRSPAGRVASTFARAAVSAEPSPSSASTSGTPIAKIAAASRAVSPSRRVRQPSMRRIPPDLPCSV